MIMGVPPLSLAISTLFNRVSVTEPVMVVSGEVAVRLASAVTVTTGELIRIHAQKDVETTIENNDDQTVKNNRTITVEGKHDETVHRSMTLESYEKIELKVGASKITMTPASISISSPVVTVTADASLTASSPLTTITGSVTLTLLNNVLIARLNGGTPMIMP